MESYRYCVGIRITTTPVSTVIQIPEKIMCVLKRNTMPMGSVIHCNSNPARDEIDRYIPKKNVVGILISLNLGEYT